MCRIPSLFPPAPQELCYSIDLHSSKAFCSIVHAPLVGISPLAARCRPVARHISRPPLLGYLLCEGCWPTAEDSNCMAYYAPCGLVIDRHGIIWSGMPDMPGERRGDCRAGAAC